MGAEYLGSRVSVTLPFPPSYSRSCLTFWGRFLLPDLTPNPGLWWYFFTEMFEHFRPFYLMVFSVSEGPIVCILSLTLRNTVTPSHICCPTMHKVPVSAFINIAHLCLFSY